MRVQLTTLDVGAIATLQAVATLAEANAPTSASAIAEAAGRDVENTRKTLSAFEKAGRLTRSKAAKVDTFDLTDLGRMVLVAWARAHDPDAELAGGHGPEIPLDLIDEDPELNPRKKVDEAEFDGLEASVREKGVIQPILIRPNPVRDGRFLVVAGWRRWTVSKRAGLTAIPAVIRELTDAQALEIAALENMQRADMNPLDEAHAFERIIAARRAADPALSLKDAKEAVSGAIGKTVRFIELRLQLLELPEAMRQQVEDGALSVTDARKFLQKRPKLLELTPRQWLIALEVYDAQVRNPVPNRAAWEGAAAFCQPQAADDPDANVLEAKGLLAPVEDVWEDGERTGRVCIRFRESQAEQLHMRFACDVGEDDLRTAALDAARDAAGFASVVGVYHAEWLNGPFEPAAEVLAEIAAEKAERQRQDEERQAQAEAEAKEREDKIAAGSARLTLAGELFAALSDPAAAFDPAKLADVLSEGGKPAPWTPTALGGIVAANGEPVLHEWRDLPPPDVLIRVRTMAVGVNVLLGLPTPDAPPAPPEPEADDHAQAFDAADLTEDEDDEELEEADAADLDDDQDTPGFLKRLAGVRDPQPAAPHP